MTSFNDYVGEMIAERRRSRTDDLLSGLIDAEEAGDRLSSEELVALVVQLIFAGHETTQNLLGNGLYRLLQQPEQLALLQSEPDRVPDAVEEMLRYDPPILFTSRVARRDLTIAGVDVAADQLVMLNLTAANHDPAHVADPARFDITRGEVRHLSFGHGAHFCLGANLARLEARVAFTTLLARYATFTETAASAWTTFTPLRGRQRLDVELRA